MQHLHLEYGAIDMRLTPDGDYVFLEINPNGEYLYVEQATGLPISRALAEHLHHGEYLYVEQATEPTHLQGFREHVQRGRPPMHGL